MKEIMLKKFLPTSLLSRFILIILGPTILTQLIATYIFYNRHWDSITRNMSYSLYNDILVAYEIKKQKIEKDVAEKMVSDLNINITYEKDYPKTLTDYTPPETQTLHLLLRKYFARPINIHLDDKQNRVFIKIKIDSVLITFETSSKRINSSTTYIFILWMTGTSLIFLFLSIIFTKNQIRPIIRLARAADRFGKGQQNIDLKPEGASEIRKAALSFIQMKERIERQITARTEMLAGISHDLRTPLTRMKLQIAMSKDESVQQMNEDIIDMELMINSYLNFARGDGKEDLRMVNLGSYLEKIIQLYKMNDISIISKQNIRINIRSNALKRCFQNIFDNALKYGNKIIIEFHRKENGVEINIHDNGPGVPEEKREEVFKPFFRLDHSRSKETGGSGLGLTVTRDIIVNHGGQIILGNSDILKGLKATIILPL